MELETGLLGPVRAYRREYEPEDAVVTDLPATAQAAWLQAGRIPDPYFGSNARDLLWMEQREWWYLKDFDLPETEGRWTLTFAGVHYRTEVWLNSVQIDMWTGSFLTRRIDLDPGLLLPEGNRLAVRTRAQERAWEDGTQADPRGFQNSSAHIRTQGPVPQYAYGWNWSPHLVAVGIWRPVCLDHFKTARFAGSRIQLDLSPDFQSGLARFSGVVERLGSGPGDLRLEMRLKHPDGRETVRCAAVPAAGETEPLPVCLEVSLAQPELWYPNGYGEQPLYRVEVDLLDGDGKRCDRRTRRAGFRRVEWIRNPGDVETLEKSGQSNRMWSIVGEPYPWTLKVNGLRIFSKGSNWCPVDNLYRDRDAHVRRLLELAREAHYVFLRIWGGGLTESDTFYDHCDELGLLCLQEFWFACGSAPAMDQRAFFENVASEIARLRERTSLALWGGGNEFNPDNPENRPVIDGIHRLVEELDGTRRFLRGSPYRGDRHGGLVLTPHYTTNKYRDLLPGDRRLVLLRSECAVGRSPARPGSIRRFLPESALWPIDWAAYQNHHAQRAEWETVTRPFGGARHWEEALLHASVFHCLDSRMNMEMARAAKYACSGCWTWQLNASWPSFHREHVDWFGQPKPVYYWYREACRPVVGLADLDRFVVHPGESLKVPLFAVNDTREPVPVEVAIRIHDVNGRLLHEEQRGGTIGPDDRLALDPLEWTVPLELAASVFYLSLQTLCAGSGGQHVLPVPSDLPQQTRSGGDTRHRNTYYLAVSPDTRADNGRSLGEEMELLYLGSRSIVTLPHYYTLSELVDEPTELDKEPKTASGESLDAVYRTVFDGDPEALLEEMEIHLPAVAADDTVSLNDTVIGSGEWDLQHEWNYEADPLRWPVLPARYYPVPRGLLRERENRLEVRLTGQRLAPHTDKRFGLTRGIFLRRRTPPELRERITAYERGMAFFAPISHGPRATLALSLFRLKDGCWSLSLENAGEVPAAFLVLDLEGAGTCPFLFRDGAFSAILPGERVETRLVLSGEPAGRPSVVLRGLNMETLRSPLPDLADDSVSPKP